MKKNEIKMIGFKEAIYWASLMSFGVLMSADGWVGFLKRNGGWMSENELRSIGGGVYSVFESEESLKKLPRPFALGCLETLSALADIMKSQGAEEYLGSKRMRESLKKDFGFGDPEHIEADKTSTLSQDDVDFLLETEMKGEEATLGTDKENEFSYDDETFSDLILASNASVVSAPLLEKMFLHTSLGKFPFPKNIAARLAAVEYLAKVGKERGSACDFALTEELAEEKRKETEEALGRYASGEPISPSLGDVWCSFVAEEWKGISPSDGDCFCDMRAALRHGGYALKFAKREAERNQKEKPA